MNGRPPVERGEVGDIADMGTTDHDITPAAAARLKELVSEVSAVTGGDYFTILAFDEETGTAHRIFSSCPALFPETGTKSLTGAVWATYLIDRQEILVTEGAAAIAETFEDHEQICSMGIHAIINLPVLLGQRCLGSVNCLYIGNDPANLPVDQALAAASALYIAVQPKP